MNLWDEKAKTYARFNEKLTYIQEQSFKKFKEFNISFVNKNILDIGCGTGIWTLHLAKFAKNIIALDSSKNMLEFLNKDAKNLKLNNINTINLDFESFCKKNKNLHFDIAFISMSPALDNEKAFEYFVSFGDIKIYIGWDSFRRSDFLESIYKHFNTKGKKLGNDNLEKFLNANNIAFEKIIFDEIRLVKRSKEEAIENAAWHLKMNNLNVDENELKKLIKMDIEERVSSKIKLIIF
ncbi:MULTISPECIES: class I SAM-dependent methyltransferase [unclassified Campylobacter]|uniref:class I SAM-dependent methyltransferase n=1 Tax=unclassified Campylobacter TaxID=2593542 RepID=UPI0012383924|nr:MULTISPECIES: class I SAM-dependent methyltransferase [unclassified Campylobacter]KAA6226454.1 methyltransferase domain-containing protein [Campylobacter sp. LR185c]KAA6228590.1 methyltransferase domain-containing protein [Campylobacter sp. LR196d]KAA6229143.1 methyltransferase domain-containing protein [Campylobacter sp. LR286c]KAA6233934.1 methyltransferase domain-containing protein [Campylobacter sp. LR291e]KAA6234173.1 methyltransferase domain-containing protein [Campylobacter sp. LR264